MDALAHSCSSRQFHRYADADTGRSSNSPWYASRIATAMHVPTTPTGQKLPTESIIHPSRGARMMVANDFDCASIDRIVALISGVDCALKRLINPGRQKFWSIAKATKSKIIAGYQLNQSAGINKAKSAKSIHHMKRAAPSSPPRQSEIWCEFREAKDDRKWRIK